MLDDYNPTVLSYPDGQRYILLPAKHAAVRELANAGVKPVGISVVHEEGGEADFTFYAEGYEPESTHHGNGGGSEKRDFVYILEDWERLALQQRRFRASGP